MRCFSAGHRESWQRDCGVTDEMCAIPDTQPSPTLRVSEGGGFMGKADQFLCQL